MLRLWLVLHKRKGVMTLVFIMVIVLHPKPSRHRHLALHIHIPILVQPLRVLRAIAISSLLSMCLVVIVVATPRRHKREG